MSLLNILQYPDKRLHTIAKPVILFNKYLKKVVADMSETMYTASGIGLAATQVDIHKQIIVIDISNTRNKLMIFINPKIIWSSQETQIYEEGCLSVPGIYDNVERAMHVTVRAFNLYGQAFEVELSELLSVCIQHEVDHLKGKIFLEYLSPLKFNRIKTKLKNNKMLNIRS